MLCFPSLSPSLFLVSVSASPLVFSSSLSLSLYLSLPAPPPSLSLRLSIFLVCLRVSGGVFARADKTVIMWKITGDPEEYGTMQRSLRGHSHFVQDVVISSDGQFALSGSWDATLRLWDLSTGEVRVFFPRLCPHPHPNTLSPRRFRCCSAAFPHPQTTRQFIGHEKDVLSVAFSADNRQIVSGSRDKSLRLWNTLGECKFTIVEDGHTEWVSCVRFSPNADNPLIVSCGWDKLVKVWNLTNCKLRTNLVGHTGYLNTVTVSPDGSLCASGGKDGEAMLWDLNEGRRLYRLDAGSPILSLVFSPNRYWLCAATSKNILIWDLESKGVVAELSPEWEGLGPKALTPYCTSLCWSADGTTLYSGYTDNLIRVWGVSA